MKVKQSAICISDDNPFAEALPGRKEIAESLSRLIDSIDEPFVIAINGSWGAGKTTFLKMWQRHLARHTKSKCIYFSAWENDFAEDPLIALIGELTVELESLKKQGGADAAAEEIVSSVKKLGVKVLKRALPVGVRIATAGLLDASDIGLDADEFAKAAEDFARKKIEEYDADKKTLSDFKAALSQFVRSIQDVDSPKPVIFIIDELDRCRPAYAIALLERLKHLFSVQGICFVLAIDRNGLLASIKAQHGSEIHAEGYLRRFIDLDYYLPDPDFDAFVTSLVRRFDFEDLPIIKGGTLVSDVLFGFGAVCASLGLTLRDVEQCFSRFVLVLRLSKRIEPLQDFVLLPFVLALRSCNDSSLYRQLQESSVSRKAVIEFIRRTEAGRRFILAKESAYLEGCLIAALEGVAGLKSLQQQSDAAMQNSGDAAEVNRLRTMIAVATENTNVSAFHRSALANVFKKIEFANGFDPS